DHAGVPIEHVSVLFGHQSVRVTEKHYTLCVRIIPLQNVPETWFTPPCWTSPARRCACHGRNGLSWKNACGSYCGSGTARAWPRCAANSGSPALPGTKSVTATKSADSKG